MGADNWAICPRCRVTTMTNHKIAEQRAKTAYGAVSEDEYHRLLAAAAKEVELKQTLREDYEIGIGEDGTFDVNYRSSCDVCGFRYEYVDNKVAFDEGASTNG